ncbi:hypothetical protein [robinz microvirus RP_77]|nr:hypothetical protein [robinz microvirus RP_77]
MLRSQRRRGAGAGGSFPPEPQPPYTRCFNYISITKKSLLNLTGCQLLKSNIYSHSPL